jgi:hypothetical protein
VEDHRGRPRGAGQVEPEADGGASSPAASGLSRVQLDAHVAEVAVAAVAPAAFRSRRRHRAQGSQVRVCLPPFGASAGDELNDGPLTVCSPVMTDGAGGVGGEKEIWSRRFGVGLLLSVGSDE